MTMVNHGPGILGAIIVNGKTFKENVKFEKCAKIVVGDYVEVDGEILFKAKKGDKFYITEVNCTGGSSNTFF